ncbi:MAG: hypothetical protein GY862_23860 [Gammaproteobacteria bacterium]|nr:hypothetical protein [Gammaproteobacteria bacterium]
MIIIKEIIALDLKDITLFIGSQASGKPTLAKLIRFFRYITSDAAFLSAEPDNYNAPPG